MKQCDYAVYVKCNMDWCRARTSDTVQKVVALAIAEHHKGQVRIIHKVDLVQMAVGLEGIAFTAFATKGAAC